MEFILGVLDVVVIYYLSYFVLSYIAYTFAGKKMQYMNLLLMQIPLAFVLGFVVVIIRTNIFPEQLSRILSYMIEVVFQVLWIFYLLRDMNKKKKFFYASTVFSMSFFVDAILILPIQAINTRLLDLIDLPLRGILNMSISLLVVWAVITAVRLASKTKLWSKMQAFGEYPKLYIPLGVIYFFLYLIVAIFGSSIMLIQLLVYVISLVYLILLSVVILIVSDIKKSESLDAAQNLLLQQRNYINKLESIQQEIRGIQHDYKNMLSGLYAQASEGNAEAVKEYIDTKLLKVDETVRENLRQMNQLTRIEIPELKGLIMTKMLEAECAQVLFRLEVMFPVVHASMATEDLLRCVGVLLDNAIEETREHENAAVTLLLLQEDKTLTIVVKNPVRDKPDLAQIWNDGYSTKGKGRGIGLPNYQNIIRKYPSAIQETKIEGENFVQGLVLAKK